MKRSLALVLVLTASNAFGQTGDDAASTGDNIESLVATLKANALPKSEFETTQNYGVIYMSTDWWPMRWQLSHRAERKALAIADRHYNRQKPGTPQFVPPGRCLVLTARDGVALWVTSWPFAEYVKHDWAGAWVNSAFRRESGPVASDLIRSACAATRWFWPDMPSVLCRHCGYPVSLVTFIDTDKTRKKRDPGRCYIRAGFTRCRAKTKGGLVVVHIPPENMPAMEQPFGTEQVLDFTEPLYSCT